MITISDPNNVLSAAQTQDLQSRSAAYPFDVHVVIDGLAPSKAALENHVTSLVNGPRTLVIGVAPTHHYTFVKGSVDLGLPSGSAIAAAGNQYFRAGDLVSGIDAIAARAMTLRTTSHIVTSQTGVPIVVQEHHTSAGVWWLLGSAALLVAAVAAYIMWRNRKRQEEHEAIQAELAMEAAELRGRNLDEASWNDRLAASTKATPALKHQPMITGYPVASRGVVSQTAAPIIINQPSPIIVQPQSSGLDNLLAYELGAMSNRQDVVIEREVVVERESSGSSSSWGGDSSSSSSSDYGSSDDSSSSSDYGSSGGDSGSWSDSGGGGSEW
jgi:hypothetical protein